MKSVGGGGGEPFWPEETLPENQGATLKRLDAEVADLKRLVGSLVASREESGHFAVFIPNPEAAISKIMMRYYAGKLDSGIYREYAKGVGVPPEIWQSMPPLPIEYSIAPSCRDDIAVHFRLTPGFVYRIFYRFAIGKELSRPESLGFFEVGKLKRPPAKS